jgi:integrase
MSRIRLTEAKCLNIKPGPRRRFVNDSLCPGLVLQITPQGHRSFMLRARFPGGNHAVRRLLGEVGAVTLDQARATARDWLALLHQGRDPKAELGERKRQALAEAALTFAVVADAYIADRLRGQRQGARSAREIKAELVARWGPRPLTSITRGDIVQLVDDLRDRARRSVGGRMSGAHARCIFGHGRALFAWAALRHDLPSSPCDRLRPQALGIAPRVRQRVLNDVEIRALWRATGAMGAPFGPFIRLLLLLGCRRGSLAGARWAEFELSARIWTIPRERAKSDAEQRVPLSDDVVELLAALPRHRSGDFVFSPDYGRNPIGGFSKRVARLLRLMRAELGEAMPSFCLHDLRRTMRSRLSECGVAERVAELCIHHGPRDPLVRIYDRYGFEREVRAAFEVWHARLRLLVSPPPENVVALLRA